jgi:RNA recognition motif-containing protein
LVLGNNLESNAALHISNHCCAAPEATLLPSRLFFSLATESSVPSRVMPSGQASKKRPEAAVAVALGKKSRPRSRTRRRQAKPDHPLPRIVREDALKNMLPDGPTPPSAGVVYVGHLPRGFYEEEIRSFFSQFGEVTRVRVARSKKTGGVKGYAFVEFSNSEVRACGRRWRV